MTKYKKIQQFSLDSVFINGMVFGCK